MSNNNPRIDRESKTVEAMINIYCHNLHRTKNNLCTKCQKLLEYAHLRLQRCPFGEGKTTCAKCPVHCYKSDMREEIRAVMRYSGPRMFHKHPILTVYHYIDGRRKAPIN